MTKEELVKKLVKQLQDNLVVELCRQDDVSEPFLNFVVDVLVKRGRMETVQKVAALRTSQNTLTQEEVDELIGVYINARLVRVEEVIKAVSLRPSLQLTQSEIDLMAENIFFKERATGWAHSMSLDDRRRKCLALKPSRVLLERIFQKYLELRNGYYLVEVAKQGVSLDLMEKGIQFYVEKGNQYRALELVKFRPSGKLTLEEITTLANKPRL